MTGAELIATIKERKLEKYDIRLFVMDNAIVFEKRQPDGTWKTQRIYLDD